MGESQLQERAVEYGRRHSIKVYLRQSAGSGTDGTVWATSRNSVVKLIRRANAFYTELCCYQRLAEKKVRYVDGLAVPALMEFDVDLLAIEMELVHPPFLLDFGKAYIDEPAPYSPDELARWHASFYDYFPRADVPRVHRVLRILKSYGIDYVDPKPWNIRFRAEDDGLVDTDDEGVDDG